MCAAWILAEVTIASVIVDFGDPRAELAEFVL
ncbi:hypothetical protein M2105_005940 [Paenibacillus sp. PastF-1]|nr:hypothetical protein [Paenibacillus sp. PastF-2]MDF9858041.1 hypothetical protein [Paenibacillus sp. PastF-1]